MATELNRRVNIARILAHNDLCSIMKYDKSGRISEVMVPGTNCSKNMVLLTRGPFNSMIVECFKTLSRNNIIRCNGNLKGICYHAIAAVILSAKHQGYSLRFRSDEKSAISYAKKNSNIALSGDNGPKIIPILSRNSIRKHGHELTVKNAIYAIAIEEDLLEEEK